MKYEWKITYEMGGKTWKCEEIVEEGDFCPVGPEQRKRLDKVHAKEDLCEKVRKSTQRDSEYQRTGFWDVD